MLARVAGLEIHPGRRRQHCLLFATNLSICGAGIL